jgi:fatty-acid desaturase
MVPGLRRATLLRYPSKQMQWNITKWLIQFLSTLGLATNLRMQKRRE